MRNVIIADDEMKVCQLIQKLADWDALGLNVAGIANDGLAALELVEKHQPDILITDIRMPGVDGIELIRRAKEKKPDLQCIIISGYRHFDYAHNAIRYGVEDYLLKPISQQEFVATLLKLKDKKDQETNQKQETEELRLKAVHLGERLKEDFVLRLFREEGFPEKEAKQLSLPAGDGYGCAIVKPDLKDVPPEDRLHGLATEKTLSTLRQHLSPIFPVLLTCAAPEGVLCVFHQGPITWEDVLSAFRALMEEILLLRALFPSLAVTVGLSRANHVLSTLPAAMREARHAVTERLRRGTGQMIVFAPQTGTPFDKEALLNAEVRKNLLAALEILDEEGYSVHLKKVLDALKRADRLPMTDVHDVMKELIYLHFLGLTGRGQTEEATETFLNEFEESWNAATSFTQAADSLQNMLYSHVADIARERSETEMRPIRLAKKYMQENYHKPLTLEDVAGVAGFNSTYFSTVFKKVTGENFLEYLSELRMKEARELLCDGHLRVEDIAEKVGYSDTKYFVKLFKKSTGLTPQEYRKLYY
jgi:two-component system, response regulator YesN